LFINVKDVASWRLCLGCGACACACPKDRITLVDVIDDGIRPYLDEKGCDQCGKCVDVCPGYATVHPPSLVNGASNGEIWEGFGPILEIWEGHAVDEEIRFHGSSGGLTSALTLYCLEKEGMHGAIHTGTDLATPWKNVTVLSKSRSDLLQRTGSRYSPASPCDGLRRIETSPGPCVFIGKPCDVVGTRMSQAVRPELDRKIGINIAFFCAGTPSTLGLFELLKHIDVPIDAVHDIRFRGKGWPGKFSVKRKGGRVTSKEISYMESWGFLQRYRPWRCHLCPDGTGEFADLSCGDPWYRGIPEDEPGFSLVVVRTERGRRILHSAREAGYVCLKNVGAKALVDSQINLLHKRRAVWGRLAAMKCFGVPTPRLEGFSLFDNWRKLPWKEKLRSTVGTARRIITRRYFRKANISYKIPAAMEETRWANP
jgi:coenzyme F420 hydrogenase subunit beta